MNFISPISKTIARNYRCIFGLMAMATFVLAGCSGGDDPEPAAPTEREKVTQMLTAGGSAWTPQPSSGVMVDGVDVTGELFAGFSITFQEKTFTTTGTSPVWLRQDTWFFKSDDATVIVRGQDSKEISITEISDKQLKLTLEWTKTTTEGGRQGSLKGTHQFILTR